MPSEVAVGLRIWFGIPMMPLDPPSIDYSVQPHERHIQIALRGDVDFQNADAAYAAIVAAVDQSEGRDVFVDLSAVAFIDSFAVRALLRASRYAESSGIRLRVNSMSNFVVHVLEMAGLIGYLTVEPSDP